MNRSRAEIAIEQQRLCALLPYVRKQLKQLSNVKEVGVGAKEINHAIVQELCFRVYVEKKVAVDLLEADDLIPSHIQGIPTDVILDFEVQDCARDDSRYRPLIGGSQIRNEFFSNRLSGKHRGAGTLGCLARTADNKLVGLGARHVFIDGNVATSGMSLGQPRYVSSCCELCTYNEIGEVIAEDETTDSAIVEIIQRLEDKITAPTNLEDEVLGIGTIQGVAPLVCFDTVKKYGAGTSLTTGTIIDTAYATDKLVIAAVPGLYPDDRFAGPGDSGAVIVNSADKVIALLVGSERVTGSNRSKNGLNGVAIPIKSVLQNLDISIAGQDETNIVGNTPTCEWDAWPGGNVDVALNPEEELTSAGVGLTGSVNWEVSDGTNGTLVTITKVNGSATGFPFGTTVNAASITVRYDNTSASAAIGDAAVVSVNDGLTFNVFNRTIFAVTPSVNVSSALDPLNNLQFPASAGVNTTTSGLVTPGVDGATDFRGKAEVIWTIVPTGIDWEERGVVFAYEGAGESPLITGSKFEITARTDLSYNQGFQVAGNPNRTHLEENFGSLNLDSKANNFQFPTAANPDKLFRLGNGGADPSNIEQIYIRNDYRDFLVFNVDNVNWKRFTDYAEWHINITGGLSGSGAPAIAVAPNSIGLGATSEKIPNNPPTVNAGLNQEVNEGDLVTLAATGISDLDNDVIGTAIWQELPAPTVALSAGGIGNTITFTAPAQSGPLRFQVAVRDETEGKVRSNGNFEGTDEVVINVVEWVTRLGGDLRLCVNNEEVFSAADFNLGAGPFDWDVTTGGTSAVIVEADGLSIVPTGAVAGASSIKVSYNSVSADALVGNTVIVQATDTVGGTVAFKRRTVNNIGFSATTALTQVPPSAASIAQLTGMTWGYTEDETISVTICAYRNGANWQAALLTVSGNWSLQARLLPGRTEVTGIGGNTTAANYCNQINDLNSLFGVNWYMLAAVVAHETVHSTRLLPALNDPTVFPPLRTAIEALTVPHVAGMNQAAAIAAIQALPAFAAALATGRTNWDAQYIVLITGDHAAGGPTDTAEFAVVNPMIAAICAAAQANGWASCPPLCP